MLFRERQQLAICVVGGVMVVGFVLLWYLPLRKRIEVVGQAKSAQAAAITRAMAESEQLPALKQQLEKLKQTVGNYEAGIPDRRDLGAFLQQIADLMSERSLKDQLVQPGKEVEAEGLICIPINVQCRGKLKQMFDFFRALQSLNRLVRIEQIKLENDSNFSGEVSMQTKTVVYCRAQAG
ncbi:MAG TPA: type 4a pilus biogenesis protein PilO [Sedimentisphaerales bacterium]|nr:type 4a pilus biogenesis protein PilO [Sedimentisphaerales bacterium]